MRTWNLRSFFIAAAMALSIAACSGASGSDLLDRPSEGASTNVPPGGGDARGPDGGVEDAGVRPDAAPDAGASPAGIVCGDIEKAPTYCNQEREYCCVSTFMNSSLRSCMLRGLSLCGGVQVGCDSANDCGKGEVCCGVYNERTSSYASIACTPRAKCEGASPEESHVVLCDPRARENECAARDETCMGSQSIKGYYVCGK